MEKKDKKCLLIQSIVFIVVVVIAVVCAIFIPKACQKKTEYKLDVACTNCSVDNQTELHNFYPENDVVTLTFKANDNYVLPDDVKATSGNKQLVKDTDYTYSKDTGEMKFNITGETNVVVDAVSIYQVNFTLEVPAYAETEPIFYFNRERKYDDVYPGTVNWGDGTTDNKNHHRYTKANEAKTYHVSIYDYTHDFFAFSGASGYSSADCVTSVILSSSIKEIGYYAFDGCRSLTSIIIPNSVTFIGEWAFFSINAHAVIDMSDVDHLIPLQGTAFSTDDWGIKFEGTIKVKNSLLNDYKNAPYWKDVANYFVGV